MSSCHEIQGDAFQIERKTEFQTWHARPCGRLDSIAFIL